MRERKNVFIWKRIGPTNVTDRGDSITIRSPEQYENDLVHTSETFKEISDYEGGNEASDHIQQNQEAIISFLRCWHKNLDVQFLPQTYLHFSKKKKGAMAIL